MRNPLSRHDNEPHDPADEELAADERARAAGTGEAAVTGDMRVAGPPPGPRPDVAPPPETVPDLPREQVATQFPEQPGAAGQEREDDAGPAPRPGEDSPVDRLLDRAEAERFHERWREVQSAFVDDPHEAVRRADELAAEVVNALGQALTAHKRTLDERWRTEKDERPDTEQLRLALRGYRSFLERMLDS
ncbi:hypothetical protein ACSNOI_11445 [Actinomadura kijaniata]|uniref:hypothetical protein n=1 Tax=Actinomadura kijaniata TaxID=46161 RepID=UPI003F1D8781